MKKMFLLITVIVSFLLTGCWSNREMTDLGIVMGLAIDKAEEGEGYELTVEAMVPGTLNPNLTSQSTPSILFSETSENICVGFRKLSQTMPRAPHLAHVSNVLIQEDVAKEGISSILGCLIRDNEFRYTTRLFVVKEQKAKDLLGIMTILETVAANKVFKITKLSSEIYSIVKDVTVTEFIHGMIADGKEAILPGFSILMTEDAKPEDGKKIDNIQTTDPKIFMKVIPYAVFKDDKLIGWLDEYHAKGVNLLLNNVKSTMIATNCDEQGSMVIEVLKQGTKFKTTFNNGKPKISADLKIRARLCQLDCKMEIMEKKVHKQIEKKFEETIKQQLEASVQHLKTELQADIIGFGEMIRRKDPLYWKSVKDHWDQAFQSLEIDFNVEVQITDFGATVEPLINELQK